jgi:hypothetical protein
MAGGYGPGMLKAFSPDIRCVVVGILVLVGGLIAHNPVIDVVGVAFVVLGGVVRVRKRWLRRAAERG